MSDPMTRCYPEPDPDDEGALIEPVEMEDHRLETEFEFLAMWLANVAHELAHRADHPNQRDESGHIDANDVELYELVDRIEAHRDRFQTYYTDVDE